MDRKAVARTLPLLLLFLLGALLSGCGKEQGNEEDPQPVTVQTQALEIRSVPIELHYSGRATGSKEVEVRARVEGILLRRAYREGEAVDAGQLLFEIDAAPFKVARDRAEAQLAQAKAGLSAAQRRWDRASELIKRDAISQRERDDALSELELAQAQVKMAEAELSAAQINLSYTQVRAPVAGITSREQVSEGSLVGPDRSLLTRIVQLDPIWVNVSIADSELLKLRRMVERGELDMVEEEQQVRIHTVGDELHPHPGQINFTESAVDLETGTVQLRATIPNPEHSLLPGQFVRVSLEGLRSVDTLTLPERAVMQSAQGSYVYRVGEEGKAEAVFVELGLRTDSGVLVASGLKAGDRVIVEGLGRVRGGQAVVERKPEHGQEDRGSKAATDSAKSDSVDTKSSQSDSEQDEAAKTEAAQSGAG